MRIPVLHQLWFLVLICAIIADLNFWYYASMGTNEADYVGIAFFVIYLAYCTHRIAARDDVVRCAVTGVGALIAAALMLLRETNAFDRGYILPYIVFALFAILVRVLVSEKKAARRIKGA